MTPPPPTSRTRVRRHRDRGEYDPETIRAILDEALICHVGVTDESGQPVVLPTAYARAGEAIYLHGAAANAMLGALSDGRSTCVTVTLIDGLVLARSAFHHSINYRSVVIFGTAEEVRDDAEKREALEAIVEHLVPGRGADARPPSAVELLATRVVRLPLDEASAKVRRGPPIDDEDDLGLPIWAGEIPLDLVPGPPLVASGAEELPTPEYASRYRRPTRAGTGHLK